MQGNVRVDKYYRERSVSIPLTWSNALLHQIWNWNALSYLTIKLWLQHENGQPGQVVSFKVYLYIEFSPFYLIQDTTDHAAAGNLKVKTVPWNSFSWLGNSGFVRVERLCWHPREVSVLGTVQLCQHSFSLVHPITLRRLVFHALFRNMLNMTNTSYQINKKNVRHILWLCFDYKLLKTAILPKCLKNILYILNTFN